MNKYFGTDGFRGEANVDLTVEQAFKVGRFLGWYYRHENPEERCGIVIGKDTRRSSYMFEYALAAGITASGADAYLLHVTTTPSVSYVVRTEHFDAGVMISASHNSYTDNGLKIVNGEGEKLGEEVIGKIEAYLDGQMGEIPLAFGREIGRTVDYSAGRNRYIGYLISLATRSYKHTRVALDCANGASFQIARSVYAALGAEVHVINDEPDGFNINDTCGSTHIESLQKYMLAHRCDVGFAFDGDADRCLAVDHEGNVVEGDTILYILARYLKEKNQLEGDLVVTTAMSNTGLLEALQKMGVRTELVDVGARNVYEKMQETGCSLGGEQSGHVLFSKYACGDDGILTSLVLMEVMLEKKQSIQELAAPLTFYPQVFNSVHVTDKQKAAADEAVLQAAAKVQETLGDTGRILLRASGTEPVVRIMVESTDMVNCVTGCDEVISALRSRGYTIEQTLKEKLLMVCDSFRIPGTFMGYEELKSGNVNQTYRVIFAGEDGQEKSYVVQRVNTYAFRKPVQVMENIDKVTEHIRKKAPDRTSLHFHHTLNHNTYVFEESGFWRLFNYIESDTYNSCEDLTVVRNAGVAFGEFQMMLNDFDVEALYYTIPDFHNTIARYDKLLSDAKEDPVGRAKSVQEDLAYVESVREMACRLTTLYNEGKMRLRVTHNDTKINNVLFDKKTKDALVVIDLDTVMPGLVGHDFGDAIRFAANFVAEDCPEPEKAGINMEVFRTFTEGFLSQTAGTLSQTEIDTLALSAFVLAVELATRFLDDYLLGDLYFKINYPEHNLVRARCQLALAKDIQKHLGEMQGIVLDCVEKYRNA